MSNLKIILKNFKCLQFEFLVNIIVQLGVKQIKIYLNISILKGEKTRAQETK
jgi:hypothetical protein